jgi:hypothetical protein
MKVCYIDLEQAESRAVGAYCFETFGEHNYLDAAECLTPDHEVLTPDGWVQLGAKPDSILTYSPLGRRLSFNPVLRWVEKQVPEILEVSGRGMALACTKKHKVLYLGGHTRKELLSGEAAKVFSLRGVGIPLSGKFVGGNDPITPEAARVIAAFQADGTVNTSGKIEFSFRKDRKIVRMHKLLQQAEIPYTYNIFPAYDNTSNPTTRFYLDKGFIKPEMKKEGSYLLSWTYEALVAWLEEQEYWDGSREHQNSFRLTSAVLERVEWIQTIAHLVDESATINKEKTKYWRLTKRAWNTAHVRYLHVRAIKGNFDVICPTVKDGFFLVRYKGKISVTGNCGDLHSLVCRMCWTDLPWPEEFTLDHFRKYGAFDSELLAAAKKVAKQPAYRDKSYRDLAKVLGHGSNYRGKPPTMSKHSHVDVKVVARFQRAYFDAFPEIPRWHRWIAEQIQTKRYLVTLMGRRRWFFTRPDDDTTLREATAYLPQSFATGDYMNYGLLQLWCKNLPIHILEQVHDAIAFYYDERDEHWIINYICRLLEIHMTLVAPSGEKRDFFIPTEALLGWNLAYRQEIRNDEGEIIKIINPDGLIVWKGKDDRQRQKNLITKISDFALPKAAVDP